MALYSLLVLLRRLYISILLLMEEILILICRIILILKRLYIAAIELLQEENFKHIRLICLQHFNWAGLEQKKI